METNPNDFPYGAYITIFLNGTIQFELDQMDFILGENLSLQFVENKFNASKFTEITYPGFKVWDVKLTGFKTACEAEKAGVRLAESFLWHSISKNFPIRLIYHKSLPFTVYDRTKGPSNGMFGFAHSTQTEKAIDIINDIKESFFSEYKSEIDRKRLLLSMEIFSASQLEITNRAKFISLITSLEALSLQKNYKEYTDHVKERIDELIKAIQNEDNIPKNVRNSLIGRIKREMSIESVRQAIMDVVLKNTKEVNNKKLFDKAYGVRSSLVHDGKSDDNIEELSISVSSMIREIFSSCLNLELKR
ncbi:HEPN domain-containing protein [Desulfobacula sp.]|uniref:HEPN domain-containing protein n=1 Tax=Desulfobacula sp. TaxID=2593537 RepID=UPI0025BCB9EE|nr:HEPN domain-containing protein [Desulfobacula sp.]MBC2704347.1 hypothetical protein [Desulfobacula sp.]